jgi:hypothetical protein
LQIGESSSQIALTRCEFDDWQVVFKASHAEIDQKAIKNPDFEI